VRERQTVVGEGVHSNLLHAQQVAVALCWNVSNTVGHSDIFLCQHQMAIIFVHAFVDGIAPEVCFDVLVIY